MTNITLKKVLREIDIIVNIQSTKLKSGNLIIPEEQFNRLSELVEELKDRIDERKSTD